MRARVVPPAARFCALVVLAALLGACAAPAQRSMRPMPAPRMPAANHPKVDPDLPVLPPAGSGRGGYYRDDGPGENPPPNLRALPDAVFRAEPYSKYANRPYTVFGKTYRPIVNDEPFVQRGVASWYGKKFHGQRTSSGEIYDMYRMTAAHPTLPIPSYARITSSDNGNQVVVRINDRGPFHASRIVDVSYAAALRLGLLARGSHTVRLERVLASDAERISSERRNAPQEEPGMVTTAPVDAPEVATLVLEQRVTQESAAQARPASVPAPGFYLQLGAFSRADAAGKLRELLVRRGGVPGALEVVQAGALYRIFSGPFGSRAEAAQAVRELPPELGLKPLVVVRTATN